MENTEYLTYRIGQIIIGLIENENREFDQTGRFPDFHLKDTPGYLYKVVTAPTPTHPAGAPIFDSGQAWRLYTVDDRQVFWVRKRNGRPYLAGYFSPDYRSGEIFCSRSPDEPGKYIFPFAYPLGGLLMAGLLGLEHGIMLHSCGVIDQGKGLVFSGFSTAGKSTTARLWDGLPGVKVVNDDHTIIRKVDGVFRVYGTPWHGEGGIALADDAPLEKIFILRHAGSNQAVRLAPAQAAALLMARSFSSLWSAQGVANTLHFLDELCRTVPCYDLGFVPDASAVEFVRCLSTG
jgi:hypothetical protein